MTSPSLTGVHHLKFPVSDLEQSIDWYARVFGAEHIRRFDHHDSARQRYAVVISIPGLHQLVELRLNPSAAQGVSGFDPVTFGVADEKTLREWITHLDRQQVPHTRAITGYIGQVVRLTTPDGMTIQIYTDPKGGFESATFDRSVVVDPVTTDPT